MKAYILSLEFGTVQIGHHVFQPCTGAIFNASMQGTKGCPTYEATEKTMAEAQRILGLHVEKIVPLP